MPCLTQLVYNLDSLKHRELLASNGIRVHTDHLESVIEAEYMVLDELSDVPTALPFWTENSQLQLLRLSLFYFFKVLKTLIKYTHITVEVPDQ